MFSCSFFGTGTSPFLVWQSFSAWLASVWPAYIKHFSFPSMLIFVHVEHWSKVPWSILLDTLETYCWPQPVRCLSEWLVSFGNLALFSEWPKLTLQLFSKNRVVNKRNPLVFMKWWFENKLFPSKIKLRFCTSFKPAYYEEFK